MDLLEVLKDYSPRQHEVEIQMHCPYRELHTIDSQKRKQAFLNPEKNLFHCFSCGTKSTAIALLTTKIGLPLPDAIDLIQFRFVEDELEAYEEVKKEDYSLSEHAPEHIIRSEVPEYFLDRGFPLSLLERFHVGMATVDEMEVMAIPYFQGGKLVGVKYRYEGDSGRYFWYSENFKKKNYLYNKPVGNKIILVEGETDVWRSILNGFDYASAILGTTISNYHIKELQKYDKVYIAFDNDTPGFLAKEKAYLKLRDHPNLLFVPYDAEDPGSCGRKSWTGGVMSAVDYSVYALEMTMRLGDAYTKLQKLAKQQLKIL